VAFGKLNITQAAFQLKVNRITLTARAAAAAAGKKSVAHL
jgi:hypothetical protein